MAWRGRFASTVGAATPMRPTVISEPTVAQSAVSA